MGTFIHQDKLQFDKWKLGVLAIAAVYFLVCAADPSRWTFLDGVDLIIHEAGHLIFGLFGEFVSIAGGTILQIMMPLFFTAYFYMSGQKFSGALIMFWLGQSFLNVSVYAADAQTMRLPLLGGDNVIHDWNYLLGRLNLLSFTPFISSLFRMSGMVIILGGAASGVRNSYVSKSQIQNRIDF